MLDFLGKRLQKSLAKIKAKTTINEADILEVTRAIKLSLLEADVNLQVVRDFVKTVKEKAVGSNLIGQLNASQQMVKIVRDELVEVLGQKSKDVPLHRPINVVMLTGLQGSGKTTTAAKLVSYYRKNHQIKKPLLVAADVYRPAAIDQLVTLGEQNKIAVFSEGQGDPRQIVTNALKKARQEEFDLVVIDTAGRLAINQELMRELSDLKKIARPHQIYLVVDALVGQDIINVAKTFNEQLDLTGFILTKLDSDARGGAALSLTYLLKIPIVLIGTGEKVGQIELFHPDRMAQRVLGMGDVLSLIEQAQDVVDEKQSQRLMHRLASGRFNLNDLIDQLKQIKKMGKMSKILKMIPGMSQKISEEKIASAERKLVTFEILIQSMTSQERLEPKLLKQVARKQRIMKGSGRSAQDYNLLINEFDRMSKQMKDLSKSLQDGSFNPRKFGLT
ncbi:signal recognition particle protein [Mycoplasma sp. ATU-Cv-508]|uniref:signal recognition particle protein n=1 Tax=Mycoplasma sp. ATU-Cv-508 TaxID=2048001 RepID=UPI000FDEF084